MLRYREGEPLVELVQHLAAAASNGDEAGTGAAAAAPGEPEGANGGDGGGGGGCFRAPAAARRGPSPGRRRVQPEPPS